MFDRIVFGFVATVLLFALDSNAGERNDVACRIKAKEVAVQMYQSCVTESRNKRIDEIRKEYQEKLAGLKNHYDRELKKMGGASTAEPRAEKSAAKSQAPQKKSAKTIVTPEPVQQEEEYVAPDAADAEESVTSSDI
ncbi:MAG: hypothetical protein V4736_12125 [Bdellovibrionota bacterium]